jgi:hypothetical protein
MYTKLQQSYVSLTIEEAIKIILEANSIVDTKSLYSIYGKYLCNVKTSIIKRNEVLAHLNIMIIKLNATVKVGSNVKIKFGTEEELFFSFLKLFPTKLFDSPLFKKISNEIWRACMSFDFKRKNDEMMKLFSEHLDLFSQGISEVSKQSCNYFLHKAVINNNLSLIQQLCSGKR